MGKRLVGFLACLLWVMGCTAVPRTPVPSPEHLDIPTPELLNTPTLASSITPSPDSNWQTVRPGLERRMIQLFAGDGRLQEELSIFRIDPTQYDFRVAYHPGAPQTLAQWQTETGALLVVNGGFFTEEFVATGLTVVEGQASGQSYGEFAGMFAVTSVGPEVRWLGARPYTPDEPLQFALQSFPVLVKPGGQIGYLEEDGESGRRTVLGQDGDGRILFILAPWGSFTLHELSIWLVESDLNLDVALNLDGGTSTGLHLAEPETIIPAFTRLPTVITISPKDP